MRKFYPIRIAARRDETRDSVRLSLDVPEELRETFAFRPGQHLPVQVQRDARPLRRTYSICSVPGEWPLEIGVRIQPGGAFSTVVAEALAVGDTLDVMPPFGQFHPGPPADQSKFYLAIAAGSGITPILSIVGALLAVEPAARVAVFYGNRRQATTMFIDDLYALKNRYPDRLQLHFLFSREAQEFGISAGRLDSDKIRELWQAFCSGREPDEAFVCGPDTMIETVSEALTGLGMPAEKVHAERFGAPRRTRQRPEEARPAGDAAQVTVVLDGHRKQFDMQAGDANIVDAAAAHGIELPYSCKGGVCATCRCYVVDGEVSMDVNYGLEPWEVEKGYILACQSRPVGKHLVLDYDKT